MKQILIIAQNTLRETIRDRILYSILGFSIMVIAASLLAGSVSLDQDIRVIQNFSLMSVLIFMLVITVFLGSQMMFREIERKTIYITLSKPVSREQFYLGKFFGLTATVSLAVLTMSIVFMSVLYFKGYREFSSIVWAVIFMLFEVPILVAVSLLFSTFSSPISSAVYTAALAVIGHSTVTLYGIAQKSSPVLQNILEALYYILPNLEKFNLRNEVVYNFNPELTQILTSGLYAVSYATVLILLGLSAFRKYEF